MPEPVEITCSDASVTFTATDTTADDVVEDPTLFDVIVAILGAPTE